MSATINLTLLVTDKKDIKASLNLCNKISDVLFSDNPGNVLAFSPEKQMPVIDLVGIYLKYRDSPQMPAAGFVGFHLLSKQAGCFVNCYAVLNLLLTSAPAGAGQNPEVDYSKYTVAIDSCGVFDDSASILQLIKVLKTFELPAVDSSDIDLDVFIAVCLSNEELDCFVNAYRSTYPFESLSLNVSVIGQTNKPMVDIDGSSISL